MALKKKTKKKQPAATRRPGQPTKYKPEYCEQLLAHMRGGLSFDSFAALCESHIDTLYEWAKRHPEFSDAKKRGQALSLRFWEQTGLDGIRGQIQYFNASAWIFAMKNRFKWRNEPEPEMEEAKPFIIKTRDGEIISLQRGKPKEEEAE